MPRQVNNMNGMIFGKLRVQSTYRYVEVGTKRRIQWQCLCDPELGGCGIVKWIFRDSLLNKRTKDKCCGVCSNTTHGMTDTVEYRTWLSMMQRCYNPKNPSYEDYGGRGIHVDERWHKFENFYEDMGKRPSKEHSLDKLNNYANYGPGNCKWATIYEQNQNRRSN